MQTNRIKRLLAAGGATIVSMIALPQAANAQFSPCAVLGPQGAFMPPPCLKVDAKKLVDMKKQVVNEVEKVRETVKTVQQARNTAQGIVTDARSIADFKVDFRLPNVDAFSGPLFKGLSDGFTGMASKAGEALYAGGDPTLAAVEETRGQREKLAIDGNAEGFAYAMQQHDETQRSNIRFANLQSKACKSKDLRTDWATNSEIKLELLNLQARQAYLMSAYLRMQAANSATRHDAGLPRGYVGGTVASGPAREVVSTDQSAKVKQLLDILAKAQLLLGSLAVVDMANSATDTAREVANDLASTTSRKDQLMVQFQTLANEWYRKSKKGSPSNTIAVALSRLNQQDQQLLALRSQPIEALTGAFQSRGINPEEFKQDGQYCFQSQTSENPCPPGLDPRDYIGSWADPLKTQNTGNLANELLRGSLNSSIEGDDDNDEFRRIFAEYNDVRLEEAWKKVLADRTAGQATQLAGTISEENQEMGQIVTKDTVTAELEKLVGTANALGQDITQGSDEGSKQVAADILKRMNELLGGGTSLPSGNVDADGNPYPPGDADRDKMQP